MTEEMPGFSPWIRRVFLALIFVDVHCSAAAAQVPTAGKTTLPRIYGNDVTLPLVIIDAGHGGVDPGAISPIDGSREKDVTLRIAKVIREQLLGSGRVRVALTRDDDRFLVLRERYGIARKLKADLFISIHCDSVSLSDTTGASVFTLSEVPSDRETAKFAMRENKADIVAGVNLDGSSADISSILIDLTQRSAMNNSVRFARLLSREAQPLIPVRENVHRMGPLNVLKAPDIPSVFLVAGYLSNPANQTFLDSEDGRKRIAEAVRQAVGLYFARQTGIK